MEFIGQIWNQFVSGIKMILGTVAQIQNPLSVVLDILVVAFIVYKAIQLVRDSRAAQLIKGIAIILITYLIADILNMQALKWIFVNVISTFGITAMIVAFQPELRRALETMGRSNIAKLGFLSNEEQEESLIKGISEICRACVEMSKNNIGALIVFERGTNLSEITQTGTMLDAVTSHDLMSNIFYPKSPLHDGAVVIRYGRIYAAGCILPLTENNDISREMGTRHRAALGMSENSDAIVVVVSEETGTISIADNGTISRGYNSLNLRKTLEKLLLGSEDENGKRRFLFFKKGMPSRCHAH